VLDRRTNTPAKHLCHSVRGDIGINVNFGIRFVTAIQQNVNAFKLRGFKSQA